MPGRNLAYYYNGKNKYDNESRNKELSDKQDEVNEPEGVEVNFNGCINKIIIEPVVEINADISGLVTSLKVVEMDEKMADKNLKHDDDNRNNELEENYDVNEGVNCIVVKPIVKIDINISELHTGVLG